MLMIYLIPEHYQLSNLNVLMFFIIVLAGLFWALSLILKNER